MALSIQSTSKKDEFIPYRDSVLTWLLKDSLGGNSRTAMIATISPTEYEESLSTLRYAERAKNIVNEAVVNEDPNAKLIRELKQELDLLRSQLADQAHLPPKQSDSSKPLNIGIQEQLQETYATHKPGDEDEQGELHEKLQSLEKLMTELSKTWEEKAETSQKIQKIYEKAFEDLGISVETNNGDQVGIHTPKSLPHLVNLSEDTLMSECLVYNIKPGMTYVGCDSIEVHNDIKLSGPDIEQRHCLFNHCEDGSVSITPLGNVFINGQLIAETQRLHSGYRLIIGSYHVFRFSHPQEARQQRHEENLPSPRYSMRMRTPIPHIEVTESPRPLSPAFDTESILSSSYGPDYSYAMREMWKNNPSYREGQLDPYASIRSTTSSPVPFTNWIRTGYLNPDSQHDSAYEVDSVADDMGDAGSFGPSPRLTMSTSLVPSPLSGGSMRGRPQPYSRPTSLVAPMSASISGSFGGFMNRNRSESTPAPRPIQNSTKRSRINDMPHLRTGSVRSLGTLQSVFGSFDIARATDSQFLLSPPIPLSSYQTRLARMVLKKWRNLRYVKLGRDLLRNAMLLKEANILSKELGQKEVYQFAILRGGVSAYPVSPLEPDALPLLADARTDQNTHDDQQSGGDTDMYPQVVIKVLDIKHKVVRVLDFDDFRILLERMRRLASYRHQPSYMSHFNVDFIHSQAHSKYSLIGQCHHPITLTSDTYTYSFTVPLVDILTQKVTGAIEGSIYIESQSSFLSSSSTPDPVSKSLTIHILRAKGLATDMFTDIHCKCRLLCPKLKEDKRTANESLLGIREEDPCSTPAQCNVEGSVLINLIHEWKVLTTMPHTSLSIELFGRAQPSYIRQVFQSDAKLELSTQLPDLKPQISERRNEDEYLIDHQHELVVWIGMLEMDDKGNWPPVPVGQKGMQKAFLIHQGFQQRVVITIGHSSGNQLNIYQIESIRFGRDCLVDNYGHLEKTESEHNNNNIFNSRHMLHPTSPNIDSSPIELYLLESQSNFVQSQPNGRRLIRALASFDTSSYDSQLLTQITARNRLVQLQLEVTVRVEGCQMPAVFVIPIHLQIHPRNAKISQNWFESKTSSSLTPRPRKRQRKSMTQSLIEAFQSLTSLSTSTTRHSLPQQHHQEQQQSHNPGLSSQSTLFSASGYSQSVVTATSKNNGDASLFIRSIPEFPEIQHGITRLFSLVISPEMSGRARLWRWNTQNQYVRGEETLTPWKPCGVSLIKTFHQRDHEERWWYQVQRTKLFLATTSIISSATKPSDNNNNNNISGFLLPWTEQNPTNKLHWIVDAIKSFRKVSDTLPPLDEEATGQTPPSADTMDFPQSPCNKLIKSITPIYSQGRGIHEGYLSCGNVLTNQWVKRWLVVEKPYIYFYLSHHKSVLDSLVNLTSARAEYQPQSNKELFGCENVFIVYTQMNSHVFQADSEKDCEKWIQVIDEWHYLLS